MTPTSADGGRAAVVLMWSLVGTAIFVEQLADLPRDAGVAWPLATALGWTAWAAGLRAVAGRVARSRLARWRPAILVMLALAALLPSVAAAGWSALTDTAACPGMAGTSPEGVLLASFRGLLLALLAVGLSAGETRFAAATTLFLVAVAVIVVDHAASRFGVAAYALVGGLWLLVTRRGDSARRREPAGVVAALAVAVLVVGLDDPRSGPARTLAGFVPLSGGDGWAFPWARGGSGDGEDLIAARDKPTATGPVDSDIFVTSHKPSLYDLWSDLYGEPEPQKKDDKPKRAVALGPDETIAAETHLPDSVDGGREFATARRGGPRRRAAATQPARALVTVAGPPPVHLRLEAFDTFDGHAWRATSHETAAAEPQFSHTGGAWMRWHPPEAGCEDEHEVTIGRLATPTLPLPARTTGLRIDRIEQADFYREPQPGLVSLDTVDVPAGTRIESRSRAGGVAACGLIGLTRDPPPAAVVPPRTWAADVVRTWGLAAEPSTWRAAADVVEALERHCTLDPAAIPPPAADDTIAHFLRVSRRGPDYCFAGAAVLLLRELGFDARLAGGFYLSGERRDPRSRQLMATGDDAHFWAEVRDVSGRWVPVEATPGYRLREPAVPWWQPLGDRLLQAWGWLVARPASVVTAGALAAAMALVAARLWRPLVDAAATCLWRLALNRRRRCPLAATWRLLEWRAWLAGRPRPRCETPRSWYLGHSRPRDPAALAGLGGFIAAFEHSVYGPQPPALDRLAVLEISKGLAAHVTRAALGARGPRPPVKLPRLRSPAPLEASAP